MNKSIQKKIYSEIINPTKHQLRSFYKGVRDNFKKSLEKDPLFSEKIYNSFIENFSDLFSKIYRSEIFENEEIVISGFYPIKSEIDVLKILTKVKDLTIFPKGIRIALPKQIPNQKHLKFFEFKGYDSLINGKFGIKEPDESMCQEVFPNIIITPLLAFDSNKHRLGYGQGNYDSTFHFLKSINHKFISIGIALDEQYYDKAIPVEDHDIDLNYLITQSKIL
jgi:5-formyltetrahydrofolate cyclo-ligase